jgi:hypothetical protein
MVSDVTAMTADGEGWSYIDSLSGADLCLLQRDPEILPNVFHYCQRYGLGTWMFGKHRLPKNFVSCEQPLMKEPPDDIALQYNYTLWPDGTSRYNWSEVQTKRNAFAMCHMIRAVNDAASHFKRKHCSAE